MSLLQPIPHRRTVRIIMWEILTERNPVLRPKMEEIQDTVIRASRTHSIIIPFRREAGRVTELRRTASRMHNITAALIMKAASSITAAFRMNQIKKEVGWE